MIPQVLTIAGTDPVGGAGLQADIKTISALGGYAISVVTAVVAQNTQGVRGITQLKPNDIAKQLEAVVEDCNLAALKIGMLGDAPTINTVYDWVCQIQEKSSVPVVLDPVMVATSGDLLLEDNAVEALRKLCTLATIVTPNVPELAVLSECPPAHSFDEALTQAKKVATVFNTMVAVKGGHLHGEQVYDALVSAQGIIVETSHPRLQTANTHGTGCTFSSALATRLAHDTTDVVHAFKTSREWLQHAIDESDQLNVGQGNGPLHHFHDQRNSITRDVDRVCDIGEPPRDLLSPWWDAISLIRQDTDDLDFVQSLGKGTLRSEEFAWYLVQDSLYLREYSRALGVAASLAPTIEEQCFWAHSSHEALNAERALHDQWLHSFGITACDEHVAAKTTLQYTQHLSATAQRMKYSELVAALLPCYWMYQDVGTKLHAQYNHLDHPYHAWLKTYADPAFARATASAIAITGKELHTLKQAGDSASVARMFAAFETSALYERDFFAAPTIALRDIATVS
ncbi:bifunctional hydroxymethylpyrimidine kinase/phosphomethylpyrimidine kinase [Timonella sp. A28]|uniref:bifunctional hydroxymethylpyrimidine kinase/phosphomethylpyrimidine kinase n=1 Tax=Timonella sp. A28 TaxID=3442640 RepID=UPI003EBBA66E